MLVVILNIAQTKNGCRHFFLILNTALLWFETLFWKLFISLGNVSAGVPPAVKMFAIALIFEGFFALKISIHI